MPSPASLVASVRVIKRRAKAIYVSEDSDINGSFVVENRSSRSSTASAPSSPTLEEAYGVGEAVAAELAVEAADIVGGVRSGRDDRVDDDTASVASTVVMEEPPVVFVDEGDAEGGSEDVGPSFVSWDLSPGGWEGAKLGRELGVADVVINIKAADGSTSPVLLSEVKGLGDLERAVAAWHVSQPEVRRKVLGKRHVVVSVRGLTSVFRAAAQE